MVNNYEGLTLEFLVRILDYTMGNIFITNRDGKIVYVNQHSAACFGLEKSEVLSCSAEDLVKRKVMNRSTSLDALQQKKTVIGNVRTGIGVDLYNISTPVYDEYGQLEYVVTWGQDKSILEEFIGAVEVEKRALETYKNAVAYYNKESGSKIVVKSEFMKSLFSSLDNIAKKDSNIILYGESGVGKDVIANYIHSQSLRKDEPFIPINCAAIPGELMESEFFGYEKGAFTGANTKGKLGFFEIADNGTLFLDEVSELPPNLQTKLLRVLESREITRIGGTRSQKINTRLIAATNRNLLAMVGEGRFREDLYYRLNVIPFTVAPLRDRVDDIEPLANLFLEEFNAKYGLHRRFDSEIIELFKEYKWRGNVRELRNIVERMVITSENNLLTVKHIQNMNAIMEPDYNQRAQERHSAAKVRSKLNDTYSMLQKEKIVEVLLSVNGNKTKAAKALGMSRGKLYRLLENME